MLWEAAPKLKGRVSDTTLIHICQIQQISPHGPLAVPYVGVMKKHPGSIQSTGCVYGHVNTVAHSEPCNTIPAKRQYILQTIFNSSDFLLCS